MAKILIIGAGQLGSRHLQAIGSVKIPIEIIVVEPDTKAREKSRALFEETKSTHPLTLFGSLNELNGETIDVAIVATNSLVRRAVIEELVKICTIKALVLEKFLFPTTKDYSIVSGILKEKKIKAWVNCPRRMFSFYKTIKSEIELPCVISVSGSAWGLGCNGIHMLDLIAFLSGEKPAYLNGSLIDDEILKSKREGYIEFTGSISGSSLSGQTIFSVSSYKQDSIPFIITVRSRNKTFVISEISKNYVVIDHIKNDNVQIIPIEIPFQSQLTNKVAEDVLINGNCELTHYEESAELHLLFLNTLMAHMNKNQEVEIEQCLIT